jgi:hypothetical protein
MSIWNLEYKKTKMSGRVCERSCAKPCNDSTKCAIALCRNIVRRSSRRKQTTSGRRWTEQMIMNNELERMMRR